MQNKDKSNFDTNTKKWQSLVVNLLMLDSIFQGYFVHTSCLNKLPHGMASPPPDDCSLNIFYPPRS